MITNVKQRQVDKKIARILRSISQPARIRILLAIGEGEACVCHMEAILGYRQAYISQHLMELRKVGIVDDRREGRYIYYRLHDLRMLDLIRLAERLVGLTAEETQALTLATPKMPCGCPTCEAKSE